ncbi:MAG: toll/interleukin-1 receptor domain-containing protein [Blastocatellia bacterium]
MPEPNQKWDFFLAHAGSDTPVAERLYDLLSPRAKVFLDSRTLLLGDNWDEELPLAQRNSLVTVVLVSANTERAYYQREEIAAAIDMARKNKNTHRVIPLYWKDPLDAQPDVHYGLRLKHGLFASGPDELPRVAERLIILRQELAQRDKQVAALAQTQQQALSHVTSGGYKERYEAARAVMEIFPGARAVMVIIIMTLLLAMVACLLFAVYTGSFDVTIQAALAILGSLFALAVSSLMLMWNKSVNLARDMIQGGDGLR